MNEKWLIVGLGNPGNDYLYTRHNAGFIVVDEILKGLKCNHKINKYDGLIYETIVNNVECVFLKPQTYMNNSGICVYNVAQYYKIPLNKIIVLTDDVNFKIGKIKIKQNGSSGGHKGINSIIETFNTNNFTRIKIGVNAKPNDYIDLKDWVVSKFSQNEIDDIKICSKEILNIIQLILENNIQKAMNIYNGIEIIK